MLTPLAEVSDPDRFGGKAVQLGAALRAGLPVPGGFALSRELVLRVAQGESAACEQVADTLGVLGGAVAVRSSALGEDSSSASFAGQHATVLNVRSREALLQAVQHVLSSAVSAGAQAYRGHLGLSATPHMAVVVQSLIQADCAGILFTRHPTTGADERVIEAAWGLGESVVSGLVTPDNYRVARGGRVLSRTPGDKDLAIVWCEAGGTREQEIEPIRAGELCLSDAALVRLDALASRCEAVFGGSQDLEWCFTRDELFLLQRRAITRG